MIKASYFNGWKFKFYPINYLDLDNYYKNIKLLGILEHE